MRVHPAAEAYRLMTKDELASLAADIKANGLHDPIVVGRVNGADSDAIVDGRNREAACKLAGVEPRYETRLFESDDAVRAFVKSRSERRDLSKGEKAMGEALLYPEPKRGRGNIDPAKKGAETASISYRRVKEARQVYRHSIELAEAVRDGKIKLDEALERVKAEREALDSAESKLNALRSEAPDLADLIAEDRMALNEAYSTLERRRFDTAEREKSLRETLLRVAELAFGNITSWANEEFTVQVYERLGDEAFRGAFIQRVRPQSKPLPDIERGAAALTDLLKHVNEGER